MRAEKMKKAFVLYGIAAATILALCLLIVPLCGGIFGTAGVFAAPVVMLLAIPLHIFGKRRKFLYILSVCANILGTALAISAYYAHINAAPDSVAFMVAAGVPLGFLTILIVGVWLFPRYAEVVCVVGLGLNLLMGVAYIVFWLIRGGVFFSFGYFMMTVAFMYAVALLYFLQSERAIVLRYASFAGFGYLIVIGLVVIVILSEGEWLDGLDLSDVDLFGSGKKKRRK